MASVEESDAMEQPEVAVGDSLDAGKVIHSKSVPSKFLPVLAGNVGSREYNMNFKERGTFLLFNHKEFDASLKLNVRNGTDKDRDNAQAIFKMLGFKVKVFQDLSYSKIKLEIRKAAEQDHTDSACFACMVLSHGEEGYLYSKDLQYRKSEISDPFLGDRCPSLAGKPKLFFLQACQGTEVDHGVPMIATDSAHVISIPTHADFLMACSTVPGYYSWRNTTEGSWFVQALCQVLREFHGTEDLMSMLIMINQAVAYNFRSNVPSDPSMHEKKQVPCITTTLTRKVFFRK